MDSNSPSLPNKAITWNHSNTARKIVNQLAVAKFVKSKTPVFSAKISDQVALNTHTTTFTLKCEQVIKGLSLYYPDLSSLGKHFLVCSPDYRHQGKLIHRHYTIANCMKKSFYDALCNDETMDTPKF